MDNPIGILLRNRDFKAIGDRFYLPNSSKRPSRQFGCELKENSSLPIPFPSLLKKFCEATRLLKQVEGKLIVLASQFVILLSRNGFLAGFQSAANFEFVS